MWQTPCHPACSASLLKCLFFESSASGGAENPITPNEFLSTLLTDESMMLMERSSHLPWRALRLFLVGILTCVFGFSFGLGRTSDENPLLTQLEIPTALTPLGQTVIVDWAQGVIIASGRARVGAELTEAQAETRGIQAARVDALRLLAVALDLMPFDSSITVAQCKANSKLVTLNVNGLIKGATPIIGSEKLGTQADGSRLASISLGLALEGKNGFSGTVLAGWIACLPASGYTGLVVDAAGLGVRPCLGPKLLSLDGMAFWDGLLIRLDHPNLPGPARWARSLEEALRFKERVGANPLMLKATAVGGTNRCDLVFVHILADVLLQQIFTDLFQHLY